MQGLHCINAYSKNPAVVAKPSAETETYGVAEVSCEGVGMKTLMNRLRRTQQVNEGAHWRNGSQGHPRKARVGPSQARWCERVVGTETTSQEPATLGQRQGGERT